MVVTRKEAPEALPCTGDTISSIVGARNTDRLIERERIAGAGAVAIRRDDGHFAYDRQASRENEYAGCIHAIIVADQNTNQNA